MMGTQYSVGVMNRREFVGNTLKAAIAGSVAAESSFLAERAAAVEVERKDPTISEPRRGVPADERPAHSRELDRHRFGANYTPSKDWWFCCNNWDADPIKSDLAAISALGADHLRILLIWPYFQPNPKWVSPLHLQRLEQLLTLMGERSLDAVVTVFTVSSADGSSCLRSTKQDRSSMPMRRCGRRRNCSSVNSRK